MMVKKINANEIERSSAINHGSYFMVFEYTAKSWDVNHYHGIYCVVALNLPVRVYSYSIIESLSRLSVLIKQTKSKDSFYTWTQKW